MRETINSMITDLQAINITGVPAHNQAWSTITATPTTLVGYGITDAEDALGNPASDGYVLSSTTGGTRSWVAQAAGIAAGQIDADADFLTGSGFIPLEHIPTGELSSQVALGDHTHGPGDANTYNSQIGVTVDYGGVGGYTGATVVDRINVVDGVVQVVATRELAAADISAAADNHTHTGVYNATIGTQNDISTTTGSTVLNTATLVDGVVTAFDTRQIAALNLTTEAVDTECYVWFSTGATGDQVVHTQNNVTTGLKFNSANGELEAASFNAVSDATLKENITDYVGNAVANIQTHVFDYIEGKKGQVGYLAQEVEAVLPNAVSTNSSGKKSVNYSMVLAAKMAAMEEEIRNLKAQLNG
jgi:hypothetical protein